MANPGLAASMCVLLLACSGRITAPEMPGSSASSGAGTGAGAGESAGTTTSGTTGTETGSDGISGMFGTAGVTGMASGSTGDGSGNVTGMSGGVTGASGGSDATFCEGVPLPKICPSGVTVPGMMAVVNGQCVVQWNCPIVTGCQQGASCAPGSGNCGYGAAGCGTMCTCNAAGYYDHCTNDCGDGVGANPDAGPYDDATMAREASVTGDSAADARVDAIPSDQ